MLPPDVLRHRGHSGRRLVLQSVQENSSSSSRTANTAAVESHSQLVQSSGRLTNFLLAQTKAQREKTRTETISFIRAAVAAVAAAAAAAAAAARTRAATAEARKRDVAVYRVQGPRRYVRFVHFKCDSVTFRDS